MVLKTHNPKPECQKKKKKQFLNLDSNQFMIFLLKATPEIIVYNSHHFVFNLKMIKDNVVKCIRSHYYIPNIPICNHLQLNKSHINM